MNYYNEIRECLLNNEVNKKVKNYVVNKSDLDTYYKVGKILSEAGKCYGEGIIKEYSKKLRFDLNKKYSVRVLYKMLKFYDYTKKQKVPTLSAQLSWSHYVELLSINDNERINYYADITISKNLSVRQLRERIKAKEYERLSEETKLKLKENKENLEVKDFVKDPIIIKSKKIHENISEKVLQKLILENVSAFLEELGTGFSFIKSEYPLRLGNRYNYIDLLLFNIEYNCYVVVELKVTELKKEHIGQIQIYMNYIDKNLKKINQDKTIGIIIVRKNNKFVLEYCSDERILTREYELI